MSDSDNSNNSDSDTSELSVDDILSCQIEFEKIVQETEEMLQRLKIIQQKIDGPSITFEEKTQSFTKWLTEWESEMEYGNFHNITWGEFLIKKLATCSDCA